MEKVNENLLQQLETKENTITELSKGWDSILKTTSQVAMDLQHLDPGCFTLTVIIQERHY
jgi:hypothetical protein